MASVKKLAVVSHPVAPKKPPFLQTAFGTKPGAGPKPAHPLAKGTVSIHPAHAAPTIRSGLVRPTTSSPVAAAAVQQERQLARAHTRSAGLHPAILQAARDGRADLNARRAHSTDLLRRNPPRATLDRATGRTGFANAFGRTEFRSGGQVSYNMRRAQGV